MKVRHLRLDEEGTKMNEHQISKTGLEVTKINGYLCHSLYDPIREAVSFVNKHIEDVQIHFIYGYGDGYIVNEFLNRAIDNNTYYVIIDPFIDISKKSSAHAAFISFKDKESLKEKLVPYMGWDYNKKITLSTNYDKMDLKKYKEFLDLLNELTQLSKVNENTIALFAKDWYKNYLYNLANLTTDSSLINLRKITNKPIIVASGGPSLTKQLPLLKRHRKDIVLIAAGSTINSLILDDIVPDIVVSIDGHTNNYEHFKGKEFNKDVLFVYNMYSYPKIRERFSNGFYFLDATSANLAKHLMDITEEETTVLEGGGSVAHFALNIASYISNGPIALIGQDLAYTGGQSHALNNVFRKEVNKDNNQLIETEGYYGDTVLTDYMFLSMKNSFEGMIKHLDSMKIYNCTEGGVAIKGFENKPFSEFCEEFLKENQEDFKVKLKSNKINSSERVIKKLKVELKTYKEIERVTKNNIYLLKSNKENANFKASILNKLNKNDSIMKEYSKDKPIETAFRVVYMKINRSFKAKPNETPREQYDRVYKQNEFLYTEMNKIVQLGQEVLEEIIGKERNENANK